jgi:UDP-glucuronate 4-epimerase
MRLLITGAAGFIGFHLSQRLLGEGHEVIGLDHLDPYYEVSLKEARLAQLQGHPHFRFCPFRLQDRDQIETLFAQERPARVVHLAAQPGIRYSLTNPHAYVESNIYGFLNILEGCRHTGVEHLVYASSSSVYGANAKIPFSEDEGTDHPISLYGATKKSNELMAYAYSHLFQIPATGLRFFTVYGPWGRPDMAVFSFTKAILEGRPIDVYNFGDMKRDFTYIDDIVEGVIRVLAAPPGLDAPEGSPSVHSGPPLPPCQVYNLGNHQPVSLLYFIQLLEEALGRKAQLNPLPLQPGDMLETYADITRVAEATGFSPRTPLEVGIPKFVEWYRSFYGSE